MLTAVTINNASGTGIALLSGGRRLGQFHGLHGLPSPRRIVRDRPGQHGEINETQHYGSRQPVWEGWLTASSASALWTEYDAILTAIWDAVSTERTLKWTRSGGTALQSAVKIAEAFDPVISADQAGKRLDYQLVFDRQDPRNYSQTQDTDTGIALTSASGGLTFNAIFNWKFTPSGAGTVSVTNSGTISTPGTFRIYGTVTSPQIQLVGSSKRIVFSGSVSVGDYLEVDTFNRTVKLNGVTSRENLLDFSATDWTAGLIPSGSSTFRLLGGTFDASARLDVISRDAYA